MDIRMLTECLSVGGQIRLYDLDWLAAEGVTTVINNRPDGEAADQPSSDVLAARARELGLDYHFIPVTPGRFDRSDAERMAEIVDAATGRVHAFCRTGNRSGQLYALGVRR